MTHLDLIRTLRACNPNPSRNVRVIGHERFREPHLSWGVRSAWPDEPGPVTLPLVVEQPAYRGKPITKRK